MMKVLHITNTFPTSNHPIFGIFLKEQIDSLKEIGVVNEVFFMNTREKGKFEYLFGYFRLLKQLILNKYDIIHCHHAYSGFIFFLTGMSIFSKRIISYQGSPKIEGGHFLFELCDFFFDAIILKANFPEYSGKKSHYLPNGTNTDFFSPMDRSECKETLNLDLNTIYILFMDSYVGRPYKRYDRFKLVLQLLRDKYKYKMIRELVLTNTNRDLIPTYINASTMHLLTSDIEGSPNSVKECLSCNIPVVSTPVGNVKELMGDIEGCYISKTFDAEELAALCDKVLKSKFFHGRKVFLTKNLEIESVAKKLLNIYRSILGK